MNKKKMLAVFGAFIILSGCSQKKSETEDNKEIIPGITLGMTKEDVFKIYGDDHIYVEDYRGYGYKNNVEYGYSLDRVDVFDIDLKTQVFFEFENDDKLVCYGYHIGRIGDYSDSSYPYSENELIEAYDKIYSDLTEWYGDGSVAENIPDDGKLKENSWENDYGSIWFIVGVNMWAHSEPVSYEKGVNEIVLSCSVSE